MKLLRSIFLLFLLQSIFQVNIYATTTHKRTKMYINIEGPLVHVKAVCHLIGNSKLGEVALYLLDGIELHEFYYRRLLDVKECKTEEQVYKKMILNAEVVRIVGIEESIVKDPVDFLLPKIEKYFSGFKKLIRWAFIRVEVGKKCKAYFEEDCDLPKNYWGGVFPQI